MDAQQALEDEINRLQSQVDAHTIPEELKLKVENMLLRLRRTVQFGHYSEEYERVAHYIDWVVNLPWESKTQDNLDLHRAREVFESHHYGLQEVKDRILEYLAVLKLKSQQETDRLSFTRAPILCLVGLVGTGKTTFAYSLAEAMGRKIARIPFGGMGSARDLRGQSRLHLEAEPGYVIKALRQAGSRNPVILLDEIDRVSAEARADIMGVLVELLDPGQNDKFVDHYLDYPFNLSEVIFIATANNVDNLATAVYDRLEPINMPSYTDEEKIVIAKHYLLPSALEQAGLPENALTIDEALWATIVRPLGYDAGIRSLKRNIEGIARKVALLLVDGKAESVHLTNENIKPFLPQY